MKTYSELETDGGSNIVGQVVEQRRRITSSLSGFQAVFAVASGKGGVGKSTLTMLLALGLQRQGRRVAVLDGDLNGPSQARIGGLREVFPLPGDKGLLVPRNRSGIGILSFGAMVPEPQPVDFPAVSRGDSFVWRATKEFAVLGDLLARTDWHGFDVLLLDLPPGSERTFQYAEFLGRTASFLLVTAPSSLSRGVVARSHQAIIQAGGRLIGYVENMSGYYCAGCDEIRPLFASSGDVPLDIPCLGQVPFEPELAGLCDQGLTLEDFRRLRTAAEVDKIIERL